MIREDLLSVDNEIFALFRVACDGVKCHREFQSEIEFNGCVDNGIEAEDFLLAVGVLRVATNANSCVHIGGELGAAKEEGIGLYAAAQDNAGNHSSFDDEIETCSLKLFLEAEDLVEDAGFVGISLLKAKSEDLHPGFLDMLRESVRRAVDPDPDLLAEDDPGRVCKTIKDPLPDISDDALELDHLTVFTELGAALVSGIGWEESAVGSQDFEGEES
jgi:hypothetical protein